MYLNHMRKMNITYGCFFTKLDLNDHYMGPELQRLLKVKQDLSKVLIF